MIATMGESLIDFLPVDTNSPFPPYQGVTGGCPFNCARAAARLGAEVLFIGKVSSDFFGTRIRDQLKADAVNTHFVIPSQRNTSLAFVSKDSRGNAVYSFYSDNTADRSLEYTEIPPLPDAVNGLMLGSISLIFEPEASSIVRYAEEYGRQKVISFDPNIRAGLIDDRQRYLKRIKRILNVASLVKISNEDLEWIFETRDYDRAAEEMLQGGVTMVLLTRGAEGSTAYTKQHRVSIPAEKVAVVDTVGAGDSFHGAVLALLDKNGLLKKEKLASLNEIQLATLLRFGSQVAGIVCGRTGAAPPWADEIPFPSMV